MPRYQSVPETEGNKLVTCTKLMGQVPSSAGSLMSSNQSTIWRSDGGILIQEVPVVECSSAAVQL